MRGWFFSIFASRHFKLIGMFKIIPMRLSLYINQPVFSLSHGCWQETQNFAVLFPLIIFANVPIFPHASQHDLDLAMESVVSLIWVRYTSHLLLAVAIFTWSIAFKMEPKAGCVVFFTLLISFSSFLGPVFGPFLSWSGPSGTGLLLCTLSDMRLSVMRTQISSLKTSIRIRWRDSNWLRNSYFVISLYCNQMWFHDVIVLCIEI